ncbi:uncharacterized protein OE_4045R [Halobacterium salinarum R1]|uniref:Uncharacterized protein n=2 Tax=Halobacterium salinarum NRC-34001 TaxID=2886895 RepID=A0A510N8T2_HALSA|nr:uncharacterized protein OE_4045R [Halobacterium salinarum R1]DAC79061.1 TPA_inf: uncharacterized protein VNG_2177a [Halobacterium salinarum NRC-1]
MNLSNDSDGTLGQLLFRLKQPTARLDTYLKGNVHLFTLIGVFGALSGYLSSLPEVRSNPTMSPWYGVSQESPITQQWCTLRRF